MAASGPDFAMGDFLASFGKVVRPGTARPLVVNDKELERLPAGEITNPSELRIAGKLPTATFELFRQTIPPGESCDMQRHYHETVHYVIAGSGHSEIEVPGDSDGPDEGVERVEWSAGSFIYTPPWAWHRLYNDSASEPAEFLTIENSRLLGIFGLVRRESAGLVTMTEARERFGKGNA